MGVSRGGLAVKIEKHALRWLGNAGARAPDRERRTPGFPRLTWISEQEERRSAALFLFAELAGFWRPEARPLAGTGRMRRGRRLLRRALDTGRLLLLVCALAGF